MNYNHYYTDRVHKKRQQRMTTEIQRHIPEDFHTADRRCSVGDHY